MERARRQRVCLSMYSATENIFSPFKSRQNRWHFDALTFTLFCPKSFAPSLHNYSALGMTENKKLISLRTVTSNDLHDKDWSV
jgi:hypothetical protein